MLPIGRHVSRLSGYAPALPTPFRDDDTIDGAAFEKLCELQITGGASALVVCGTTGEAPTLTAPEQRQLVAMAVKIARGRVPVIAGAGSNSTAHAIELTRDAEAAGADAILSVVPYYNKPAQAGMHAHFSRSRNRPDCRSFSTTYHHARYADWRMKLSAGSPKFRGLSGSRTPRAM